MLTFGKWIAIAVVGGIVGGSTLVASIGAYAGEVRVKISTSKIAMKDKAAAIRRFQRQIANVNRKLRGHAGKGKAPFQITSANVVDDCTATIWCGGKKKECSIKGPGTCEAGLVSGACIQGNSTTTITC